MEMSSISGFGYYRIMTIRRVGLKTYLRTVVQYLIKNVGILHTKLVRVLDK